MPLSVSFLEIQGGGGLVGAPTSPTPDYYESVSYFMSAAVVSLGICQ